MSKECLNALEMSKAEDKVTEFFNNADAVQAEEGAWYYSESSVNSELLSIYAELAKANERVKELEFKCSLAYSEETGFIDLNKFAIEQKIEVIEEIIKNCQSYSLDGMILLGGVKAKLEQLRKGGES